jgi:isopentenyldiphosphate isomerase
VEELTGMRANPGQELVDVIDEQGRVVGAVTRAEMRGKRLLHRCVYILVFNPREELFVHLRTPTKDVYPSHWDVTVGGVLRAGEWFDDGARREMAEELGVQVALEGLFPFRYEDAASRVQAMVYKAVHEGPFRLQTEEIVRGEFVPISQALGRAEKDLFCPDSLAVLSEYLRRAAIKPHEEGV